jgi:SAM-dependent methyltransferase
MTFTDTLNFEPAQLEHIPCPLCGENRARTAYSWSQSVPFQVQRCCRCKFFYLSPRPHEAAMASIYSDDGYYDESSAEGYADYAVQRKALGATFARLMKNLKRRGLTGGSLLEVGCGFGFLLAAAEPYFERRHGTDFSPRAARSACQHADRVFQGGLDQIPGDAVYDCIISNQVIEHVHQPRRFLTNLSHHLRPGGVIITATPDMGSFWRRLMGRHWPSFKLPEHILYFDRHSLARLLSECGFESPAPLPYPHAFPLALVAAKFGMKVPDRLADLNIWLPRTTLALAARKPPLSD